MSSIRPDFIPHAIALLRAWLLNAKTMISTIAGAIGYTGTQTTTFEDKAQEGITAIDDVVTAKANYKSKVKALHDWMKPNGTGLTVLRGYANTIKTNPEFTPKMGETMKFFGSHEQIDFEKYKPHGTAKAHKGYITLKYEKLGVDLMSIYYRMKGSLVWIHIGNMKETTYHHHFELPVVDPPVTPAVLVVVLEYQLIGVHHDIEIGLASDIIFESFEF